MEFIQNPAVQAGILPVIIGIAGAAILGRQRLLWFVPTVAYAVVTALATGFDLVPLTSGRKVMLVSLLAPFLGLALDSVASQGRRRTVILGVIALALTPWVFWTVIAQGDPERLIKAVAVAITMPLLVALLARVRTDGIRTAALGVGLGLAVAISAFISASIGFLFSAMAIAAACGGILLVLTLRNLAPESGFTAVAALALALGLFVGGSAMLAEMPWYAVPLFLVPVAAVCLPLPSAGRRFMRSTLALVYALAGGVVPVLAAWLATR
jgi:hypothetical protein